MQRRRMMKMHLKAAVFLILALSAGLLAGCGTRHATKKKNAEADVEAEGVYGMILSSSDDSYTKSLAEGFKEVMDKEGKTYTIEKPKKAATASQFQNTKIAELTREKASCIAIAPVSPDAQGDALKAAMDAGVDVLSFDTAANPDSRELFVNQTGTREIAETLMDAVLDLTEASGEWAVLSSSSTAANQNEWIGQMKETMKDKKYQGLKLVEIAYGDDQYQRAYDQTKSLLLSYPDLEVICAPTTQGMKAAAAAITDTGSKVKLTGFGLPSEMADYVGSGKCCSSFYLWNPVDLGKLTAYASIALHDGTMTGDVGDSFDAGDMGAFTVTQAADDGTEVIVGYPYKFDSSNIDEWKDVF
ncbi:MAG: substrate-binding domain-containing protein [Lachnospiraceae bacterium]|nr:substrate-binding domain-containing protein [Lachnospiraceae bacterium]